MPTASRWSSADYPDYKAEVNSSIGFSGLSVDFFAESKAAWLLELAAAWFPDRESISTIDVGCGVGVIHPFVRKDLGRLVGVDVSEEATAQAARNNPEKAYVVCDGRHLPFTDTSFDLCFTTCVMHHVPPEQWLGFLSEMHRITSPGGGVAIFEHNPFNPVTRFAVSRCEFDEDAILLRATTLRKLITEVGFCEPSIRYITFIPSRAHWVHRVERMLGFLPLGAQYLVTARR